MDELTWKVVIGKAVTLKAEIAAADTLGVYPHRLPRVAATEEELRAAALVIGEALDPEYERFLRCAGGWPAFFQDVDLFGPLELTGHGLWSRAAEMLTAYEDEYLRDIVCMARGEVFPIAVSGNDIDVFVMRRLQSPVPGEVVWLAGAHLERYGGFEEFFLAMQEANSVTLQAVKDRQARRH
jgi:hypothetical protein